MDLVAGKLRRPHILALVTVVPALLVSVMVVAWQPSPGAQAAGEQAAGETVHFQPAASAPVPIEEGPFGVFIVVDELRHQSSVGDDGLGAFELTIVYDPSMVEFREARLGGLGGDTKRNFQCLQRSDVVGSISFGCISSGSGAGPEGDLTLAEFSFEPIAPGATTLTLEDVDLVSPLAEEIAVTVESVHPVEITGSAPVDEPADGPNNASDPPDVDDPVSGPDTESGGQQPDGGETGGEPDGQLRGDDDPSPSSNDTDPDAGATPAQVSAKDPDGGSDRDGAPAAEADGGSSTTAVVLWSVAAGAGLAAFGALGLAGVQWRRKLKS